MWLALWGHLTGYLDLKCWNYYVLFGGQILNWRWITMLCARVYPGDHGPNIDSSYLTNLMILLIFILEGSLSVYLHMGTQIQMYLGSSDDHFFLCRG